MDNINNNYEINPLNYNSLNSYINTHDSFKLKHIIEWCCKNTNYQLAEKLLLYIGDNNLSDMESNYMVNHISFNEFANREKEEEYDKYLGYDMYKI
jgi:hypothetical protein